MDKNQNKKKKIAVCIFSAGLTAAGCLKSKRAMGHEWVSAHEADDAKLNSPVFCLTSPLNEKNSNSQ